jgi:glycosyltransferase involved in cell wall biosynthesis
MRLLFIADGRSPIALNWIQYFVERGEEVHLVSTFPCVPELRLASLTIVPAAFGEMAGEWGSRGMEEKRGKGRWWKMVPRGMRTAFRQWLGPFTLPGAARRLRKLISAIQPDLIHAMRIPYEGMVTAMALGKHSSLPFLVSIWGNDFTLHAHSTPLMAYRTRYTLRRAHALHTDCQRDRRLADEWGFSSLRPTVVLPGNGGIQLDVFYPPSGLSQKVVSTIINPRGFRAYVRNDTFFRAIPLVLEQKPETRFLCPAMANEAQALRWVDELGIAATVELLPKISRLQMADLFRQAQVAVSITTHDGTPNTLLEAMACGCFPIAGDINSLREWITPGVNGLLVEPTNPRTLAEAMIQALEQPALRTRAAEQNTRLIAERAEYGRVMGEAEKFYGGLIGR